MAMYPRSSLHNWRSTVSDYWALTKPEVNVLVLASTLAGFYLGSRGPLSGLRLAHTLLGTLLVASGTATLNQFIERKYDARMRRTANRPLPAGKAPPSRAFGVRGPLRGGGALELAVAVDA